MPCNMALPREAEEDFKLPLRPWLEKQINSKQYKGLEWEMDEQGNQTRHFRLPWVKKNLPDWLEYYKIFRAWAEHRGRGSTATNDDSKLKSNFRCALNKSVDFEEVPDKSTLHHQTGNYKVYRILSPQEVREKKSRKVLSKEDPESHSSFHANLDSGDFKSVDKSMDFLEDMDIDLPPTTATIHDLSTLEGTSYQTLDNTATMTSSCAPPFYTNPNNIGYTHINVVPPIANEDYSQGLAISPAQGPDTTVQVPPQNNQTNNAEMMSMEQAPELKSTDSNVRVVLDQFDKCGITLEDLNNCDLIIQYNGKVVFRKNLQNLDKGYRIFFGDQDEQVKLLRMKKATEEKLSDFNYSPIKLPDPENPQSTIGKILEKTDLGFVIQFDPSNLVISAKRLCQSQIFFFDTSNGEAKSPVKLEREELVPLFSHVRFLVNCLDHHYNNGPAPMYEVLLSVGMKPKSPQEMRFIKGIQVKLVPHVVNYFIQNRDIPNRSLSLCFSNPTSMEELLRQIHE